MHVYRIYLVNVKSALPLQQWLNNMLCGSWLLVAPIFLFCPLSNTFILCVSAATCNICCESGSKWHTNQQTATAILIAVSTYSDIILNPTLEFFLFALSFDTTQRGTCDLFAIFSFHSHVKKTSCSGNNSENLCMYDMLIYHNHNVPSLMHWICHHFQSCSGNI